MNLKNHKDVNASNIIEHIKILYQKLNSNATTDNTTTDSTYKSYVANFTVTTSGAPTINFEENNLETTVTPYDGGVAGQFGFNFGSDFPDISKIMVFFPNHSKVIYGTHYTIGIDNVGTGGVTLQVFNLNTNNREELPASQTTNIEIRVYN